MDHASIEQDRRDAIAHKKALNAVVDAWESLPGGRNHSPRAIELWLSGQMTPAINKAREALGRKAPGV
jgi:hypothetical protein